MKKTLSVFLSLVMVFTLCAPTAFAVEAPEQEIEAVTFHAPTIRKMIEVNLELGNADEQFFHMLANAYLADPALLVETIMDLPGEDITYLAKAISYDLQKTGRADQAVIPSACNSPVTSAIAKLIYSQASNPENATLDAFYAIDMFSNLPGDAAVAYEGAVMVSSLVLSTYEAEIYAPVTATFTVTNTAISTSSRMYTYCVYRTDGATDTMIQSGRLTHEANAFSTTITLNLTNNAVGEYSFYVWVYPDIVGTYISSGESSPITVTGKWHITVELTADRTQLGTITLFNAEGTQVSSSICLGRSDDNLPMNRINGHTPIGVYTGILYQASSNTYSFGPYRRILLDIVSGYAADECSHRSELMIHGGDPSTNTSSPSYPLRPTYGCVRVTNDYQLSLITQIDSLISSYHYSTGQVTVTQDGLTDI